MMAFTQRFLGNVSGAGEMGDEVTLANGIDVLSLKMTELVTHPNEIVNISFINEPSEYIFDRKDVRIMFLILYTIVFCCCFFGNLMVILVVSLHWRMRSITNFCLANLAFADLCVGIFCVYQNIVTYLMESWVFGEFMCKMYHFTNSLSTTASVLILVVICIERYLAIIHPMTCKQMLTKSRLRVTIAFVWILSAAISSPRFYYFSTISMPLPNNQLEILCLPNRTKYNSKLMDMLSMTLLFLIPLTIIIILYTHIGIALWKSSSNRMTAVGTPTPSGNDGPQCECYAENQHLNINEALSPPTRSNPNQLTGQENEPNNHEKLATAKDQKQSSGLPNVGIKRHFSLLNFPWPIFAKIKDEKPSPVWSTNIPNDNKGNHQTQDFRLMKLSTTKEIPQPEIQPAQNIQEETSLSSTFNKTFYSYINEKFSGESSREKVVSSAVVNEQNGRKPNRNASKLNKFGRLFRDKSEGHTLSRLEGHEYTISHISGNDGEMQSQTCNQDNIHSLSNPIRHQNSFQRLVNFNRKSSLSLDSCSDLGSLEQIYGENGESCQFSDTCSSGNSAHQLRKCLCSNAHNIVTSSKTGNCACSSGQCQLKQLGTRSKAGRRVRITRSNRNGTSALLARKKIVRMLIVVVLAFAICHLPFHARKVWQYWSPTWAQYEAGSVFSTLFTPITFLIMYANSAMNPILYAFMSRKFQMSFKDLLCCKLRRSLKVSGNNKLINDK